MQVYQKMGQTNGVVYTVITGAMGLADIQSDVARFTNEPAHSPIVCGLVDMRRASATLTVLEIIELAQIIKNCPWAAGPARRALLVSTDFMYMLCRMFESFPGGGAVVYRVFRKEREALDWLQRA